PRRPRRRRLHGYPGRERRRGSGGDRHRAASARRRERARQRPDRRGRRRHPGDARRRPRRRRPRPRTTLTSSLGSARVGVASGRHPGHGDATRAGRAGPSAKEPPMSVATIGEHEFFYEEHGSGTPLLLIMGLGADSAAWLFQVPEFAQHYRTITFDNRGIGRSAKPAGPYSIAGMAEDAAGLLDHLGVERAHVVGVSMGGMIAQELVLRHSGRVRGLVLACTFPEPDEAVHKQREASITRLGGALGSNGESSLDLGSIDPFMFLQQMLPTVFNQAFIETELPKILQVFSGSLQWGFSMDAILCQVAAVMGHRV